VDGAPSTVNGMTTDTDPPASRTAAAVAAASAKRREGRLRRLAQELSAAGWAVTPPEAGARITGYPHDAETYAREMLEYLPRQVTLDATVACASIGGRISWRAVLQESLLRNRDRDEGGE
jgi:hypothetical protein